MYKLLCSWLIPLVLIQPVQAEVIIDAHNRIRNMGYGVCAWCAIETSARQFGISELIDLAIRRNEESQQLIWVQDASYGWVKKPRGNNGGNTSSIREQLRKLKVKYTIQSEDVKDTKILYNNTRNGRPGCVVGIR